MWEQTQFPLGNCTIRYCLLSCMLTSDIVMLICLYDCHHDCRRLRFVTLSNKCAESSRQVSEMHLLTCVRNIDIFSITHMCVCTPTDVLLCVSSVYLPAWWSAETNIQLRTASLTHTHAHKNTFSDCWYVFIYMKKELFRVTHIDTCTPLIFRCFVLMSDINQHQSHYMYTPFLSVFGINVSGRDVMPVFAHKQS